MFDYACIYSPDLGDDEHVEQQLVFTKGSQSVDEFVKLIGVAQGIAELAYSFDHKSPAKWFKTGRGATAKLVLVVPLANSSDDWRSGYWFAGQLSVGASHLPAEAVYRHIQLGYEHHRFLSGHSDNEWPDLTEFEPLDLCTVIAPNAIRLAPGTLSPTSKNGIENVQKQAGAADIIITTVDDGSAVWPGEHLNVNTRIQIQRWLARKTNRTASQKPAQDIAQSESQQHARDGTEARNSPEAQEEEAQAGNEEEPTEEQPLEGQDLKQQTPETPGEPEESHNLSEIQDPLNLQEQREPSDDSQLAGETSTSSWFTMPEMSNLSMSNLSMASLPSMTMPSLPSLPSVSMPMPNMSSVNEYLPSVSSALRSWWDGSASGPTEEAVDEAGFVYCDLAIHDAVEDRKWYVTAYRRALFVYFLVYPEPTASKAVPQILMSHFEALVAQLEGFSFAFAPPTRFNYLILDRMQCTVTSTFPNTLSTDILATLLSPRQDKPQVVRVGSTWLYFVTMKNGAEAVFGKKGLSSQQGSLLGALHSDVEQWLNDYERRAN